MQNEIFKLTYLVQLSDLFIIDKMLKDEIFLIKAFRHDSYCCIQKMSKPR